MLKITTLQKLTVTSTHCESLHFKNQHAECLSVKLAFADPDEKPFIILYIYVKNENGAKLGMSVVTLLVIRRGQYDF